MVLSSRLGSGRIKQRVCRSVVLHSPSPFQLTLPLLFYSTTLTMSTFYRIAAVALFVFSFGLLVGALPSPRAEDASWVVLGADKYPLCALLHKFILEAKACIEVIAGCNDIVTLKAKIAIFVALCNACAADLLKIGANIKVTADIQVSIVTCFVSLITLLVKVCLDLTVKLGVTVVLTLLAEIDIALRLCLVNLDICVGGILELILKGCTGSVFAGLKTLALKACLGLFVSAGVSL
ncbi:unnamed protein product [Rhizoctonia solani]|uniref:Transmembrane protein n=1 Tax=Rhizoctonia solani TaxID=456999 RepID=A0A8H3HTY5_9AGAM|nr:unnamed protein product [Rhizoctonia solani]